MPGDNIIDRRMTKKDKLIEYLNSGKEDESMEKMWDTYVYIEDKMRSMNRKNAMTVVRKKYSISRSLAYKLIKEVEIFSGQAHAPDKDYLRWVQVEKLQMAQELAINKGDLSAVARISDQLFKWINDSGDLDQDLLDKLEPRNFNMQININGANVDLPLERFYNLQDSEVKKMTKHSTEDIAPWDEIEKMLNGKD